MRSKKEIFTSHINFNGAEVIEGSPCWEFLPKSKNTDRKKMSFNLGNGKIVSIHLAAFLFFVGEFPEKNVFSVCKTSFCVNPSHFTSDKALANGTEYQSSGNIRYRLCPSCKKSFPKLEEFFYVNTYGTFLKCKKCSVKSVQISRANNWERVLLYEAEKRHRESGIELSITLDDIKRMYEDQDGKCYWTGVDMKPSPISKYPLKPSLDRIDGTRGYTKDNVVLCCLAINIGRNSSSKKVFEEFVLTLKEKGIDTGLWK